MDIQSIDVIESSQGRLIFAVTAEGQGSYSVAVKQEDKDTPSPEEILHGTGEGFFFTKTYIMVEEDTSIESFTVDYDLANTSYEIWVAGIDVEGNTVVKVSGVVTAPSTGE